MTTDRRRGKSLTAVLLVLALAIAGGYIVLRRSNRSLSTAPRTYEEVVRSFYRALASLQVGLLDDAKTGFTRATELVPGEPASWANLSLAQMRLGDFDGAFQSVQRAVTLSPTSSIEFLFGQLEKVHASVASDRPILDAQPLVDGRPLRIGSKDLAQASRLARPGGGECAGAAAV